ncbi:MAG: SDR family oxidoreductase [Hyphomicrobiaceae bacterium]|nr:SDR family oxidoreductase [Hyphomicrobiaceae bacterium]
MNLGLAGKVALVGGASQGIGYAIARLLAAEGMSLAIAARREPALLAARDRIVGETGAAVLAVPTDLRSAESCTTFVTAAAERFGRIDALVNNDGAPPLGRIERFEDGDWTKAVDQNLMSVVRMVRACLPHMRAAGGGRIVNITALSALQPMPEFGLSVATWAGVIGLAKTLSLEIAADNITINTICPGRIRTERLDKVYGKLAKDAGKDVSTLYADLAKEVPLKRLGEPDDIAGIVAFLVSNYGGYITGTTTAVDGGRRTSLL